MASVSVRVPATTANLAAGFDSMGCALQLYNTLTFTPAETLSFSGCEEVYCSEENLAYQAYARVMAALGLEKRVTQGILRISFAPETTREDIDALYEALKKHHDTRFPMF